MRQSRVPTTARFVIGALVTAIYLLPLFWMVATSIKPPDEIIQTPPVLITTSPQIESYKSILGLPNDRPELYVSTLSYLKNSIIIGSATTALTLLLGIPAAYALARFRLRGARLIILAILVAQMLPGALLVMPLFVIVRSVGLYGSQLAVIIADTALALPLAIILLQTSFRQVPKEVEEAAWVDGASRLTTLRQVVVPLVRPGLVAVAVLSFLTAWASSCSLFRSCPTCRPSRLLARRLPVRWHVQDPMGFDDGVRGHRRHPRGGRAPPARGQFVSGLTAGSVKN